jgi:hypothetical protein
VQQFLKGLLSEKSHPVHGSDQRSLGDDQAELLEDGRHLLEWDALLVVQMGGQRQCRGTDLMGGGTSGRRGLEWAPALDGRPAVSTRPDVDHQSPHHSSNVEVLLELLVGVLLFDHAAAMRALMRALPVMFFINVLDIIPSLSRVTALSPWLVPLPFALLSSERRGLALRLAQCPLVLVLPFDELSKHVLQGCDVGQNRRVALREQLVGRPWREDDRGPHGTIRSARDRRRKTLVEVIEMIGETDDDGMVSRERTR